MLPLLRRLRRLEGTIDRRTYAIGGVVALLVKFSIEWLIARFAFDRNWTPLHYWQVLSPTARHAGQEPTSTPMLLVLLAIALPFLWFGVSMTLLRLRDARLSPGWVVLFFLPGGNLLLFVTLMLFPSREPKPLTPAVNEESRRSAIESAALAVLLSTTIALAIAAVSFFFFKTYGFALFMGVPFVMGFVGGAVHGHRQPRSVTQCFTVAIISLALVGGALLGLAWEGVICLSMAFPIALPMAMIGAYFGYLVQPSARLRGGFAVVALPALLPLLVAGEATMPPPAPLYAARTSIIVDAPPERVWRNVIEFRDIDEQPEWYFRAGIAYPLRAKIVGSGPGAKRYCVFTTGAFVEPIEVWDPPRRLKFSVTSNPPPMRELSPYADVRPAHLDGFLMSRGGQFELEPLPGGRTRLTGTTWYQHHLWPAAYWRLWSDAIIHRIHLRVLRHIASLSTAS
ncbi:MAG TPA: hypothetical protein VN605_05375 [Thermoanaerobaculia bacterium]|nr:hypothetical protein [Thermoanaerobaculia bacterium]